MPTIEANGTTLHYQWDGPEQGAVVMLSNSLASNLGMWEPQIGPLTGAGFRVLRYDSRGHGQSAAPEGPYTMELLTGDAVGLMDALALDKVHFCGLSKGGMVGQMLGTQHGGRLLSLALCDTSAHMPASFGWDERIATTRESGMAAVVDATIDRWFTKPGQQRLPRVVESVREMILTTPVEGFCACCAAIRDMDQRESIRGITTPALVMVGEEDPGTTVAMAQDIQSRIGGSKLVVLPEAAHFSNMEQAGPFNEALLGFLKP
ncbi:MAG: 3-oxoadipate enol-lactonase [SAR324 cluster bacterium]|nr:3-oxoadipate enol-lactonase [SAR324 cluster bacterium]MCZ6645070.1 3-oxoadipate enol-lactonase [SAR324 cluster bacterium]